VTLKGLRLIFALAWVLFAPIDVAIAQTQIVDGDTLKIGGITYRLNGIDAPEARQKCKDEAGRDWSCGTEATEELKRLTRWKRVTCNPLSKDQYGRTIAVCFAGGKDLGSELVSSGLAWAYRQYSMDYVIQEDAARLAGLGIWQATNTPAWEYRRQGSTGKDTTSTAATGCLIKGNISSSGKIYHTPSSPWYSRTKIDTSKGERWFCSEAEARAAGWRVPR